jgi:signal transduction histidine kinase
VFLTSNSKILVVEDEWIIALDIKLRLEQLGYIVPGIAQNSDAALKVVAESQPDLILMDIHLQGETDGIETANQIREQFHLPIIFLTAYADEVTLSRAVSVHPFGYIIKPFKDEDLNTAIQIALANHKAELLMQQAIEKEKEINELRSQFVSIVSHEFRNPLSSLTVIFDLLERQELQLSVEQRRKHFQRGKSVVRDMAGLIDDVLLMGEVSRSQFQYEPAPINLLQFCSNLVDDLKATIGAKHNLQLVTKGFSEATDYFCNLDSKLLQHILVNLLSNAIKYSPDTSEVRFTVTREPEQLIFQIQDQGIGISPEDQKRLFTPFHRGANARRMPGTGLGLSIVKRCVDAHQGAIAITSEIGVGTTITVTLQRCDV